MLTPHRHFTTATTPLIHISRYIPPLGFDMGMGFVVAQLSATQYIIAAPRHLLADYPLNTCKINRSCTGEPELQLLSGPYLSPYGHDLFFAVVSVSSPIQIARWELPFPFLPLPVEAEAHYCTWNMEQHQLQAASGTIVRTDSSGCFNWETGKQFVIKRTIARQHGYAVHYVVRGLQAAAFGWSGSPVVSTEGELLGMLVATINAEDVDDGHTYAALVSAGDIRRNADALFG